jgi:branched-subunit amino acid aminotransferase/4-amino-4-deoxychorismate lyase
MNSQFILFNEKFFFENEPVIGHNNRAFSYGDALFETIHCLGTEPQFLEFHLLRLLKGMKVLKMQVPEGLNSIGIKNSIGKLLNKNRIFKGARIRLTIFRDYGGFYLPEKNTVSWIMESSSLENEQFKLDTKGLAIDIFDDMHKPVNLLSNLKTTNSLIYVLAGIFRKENKLDEAIILNQYGRICESISSNVFVAKDNKILTPPLSEGCIEGTMRQTILGLSKDLGYYIEERGVLEKNLVEADEVFLTKAIQGIKWVSAYKDRRYYNFVSRKFITVLNQKAFKN